MKRILTALVMMTGTALPLQAQQKPVVVELFTSQGCSSCPPADQLLHELSLRDDVLPLSFHVDYWDYIGWKDSFGDKRYTERQYAYAKAAGRDMVYTPEMIINGEIDLVGNRTEDVYDAVVREAKQPLQIRLTVKRVGDQLVVHAESQSGGTVTPSKIRIIRFVPKATVAVTRGENAGRDLHYTNVVRDIGTVGNWEGTAPLQISLPISGDMPAAVLLQSQHMGRILSAAIAQ